MADDCFDADETFYSALGDTAYLDACDGESPYGDDGMRTAAAARAQEEEEKKRCDNLLADKLDEIACRLRGGIPKRRCKRATPKMPLKDLLCAVEKRVKEKIMEKSADMLPNTTTRRITVTPRRCKPVMRPRRISIASMPRTPVRPCPTTSTEDPCKSDDDDYSDFVRRLPTEHSTPKKRTISNPRRKLDLSCCEDEDDDSRRSKVVPCSTPSRRRSTVPTTCEDVNYSLRSKTPDPAVTSTPSRSTRRPAESEELSCCPDDDFDLLAIENPFANESDCRSPRRSGTSASDCCPEEIFGYYDWDNNDCDDSLNSRRATFSPEALPKGRRLTPPKEASPKFNFSPDILDDVNWADYPNKDIGEIIEIKKYGKKPRCERDPLENVDLFAYPGKKAKEIIAQKRREKDCSVRGLKSPSQSSLCCCSELALRVKDWSKNEFGKRMDKGIGTSYDSQRFKCSPITKPLILKKKPNILKRMLTKGKSPYKYNRELYDYLANEIVRDKPRKPGVCLPRISPRRKWDAERIALVGRNLGLKGSPYKTPPLRRRLPQDQIVHISPPSGYYDIDEIEVAL